MEFKGYTFNIEGRSGQFKEECPNCKALGKGYKDKSLSINADMQMMKCHKCNFSGFYGALSFKRVEYKTPSRANYTSVSDKGRAFLLGRGITIDVIQKLKISSDKYDKNIVFPYFENGTLVNVKSRGLDEKRFLQSKGGKQTMYNIDSLHGETSCIIVEGEVDVASIMVAGLNNVISVPQGAPNAEDKNIDRKLEGLLNCFDIIDKMETIYIAVDSDANGQRLKRELIKMFTAEKCKVVSFGEYKDANEALTKANAQYVLDSINDAKTVLIDGVFEAKDFELEMLDAYRNTQPKGTTTHFLELDPFYTHRMGEVTLWTGYNNEGKSLFLKQLLLAKAKFDGWKIAIFSPEEMPLGEFFTDLIESYIGGTADKDKDEYMTELDFKKGISFVNNHFYAVNPKESHGIDDILKRMSYVVRKNGVKAIVLDPYNQIHHRIGKGEREDLYISKFMSKLKQFALQHDVAVHLVAHQLSPIVEKGKNYPQPNIYKIKGGGTFGDKADNVMVVWREHRNTDPKRREVTIISQKIKKMKLTGITGMVVVEFDTRVNRYYEIKPADPSYRKYPLEASIGVTQQEMELKKKTFFEPQVLENNNKVKEVSFDDMEEMPF